MRGVMPKVLAYWRERGHVIPEHVEEAYKTIEDWEKTQMNIKIRSNDSA